MICIYRYLSANVSYKFIKFVLILGGHNCIYHILDTYQACIAKRCKKTLHENKHRDVIDQLDDNVNLKYIITYSSIHVTVKVTHESIISSKL